MPDDRDIENEQIEIARQRLAEMRSGNVAGVPGDPVLARVQAFLDARHVEKLSSELSAASPSDWREDVLISRAGEWERRDELSQDWEEVRTKLGGRKA